MMVTYTSPYAPWAEVQIPIEEVRIRDRPPEKRNSPKGRVTLADALREDEEALRRRFVFHTRKKGPLTLDEAIAECKRMEGESEPAPERGSSA
jgi:hypothetical protein